MNIKIRSTKSLKWRHTRKSVGIAWTNEQKADLKWLWHYMVVTKILTKKKTANNSLCYRFAAINQCQNAEWEQKKQPWEIEIW